MHEFDADAQRRICERLIQELKDHDKKLAAVRHHGTIPKSFISHVAVQMLDACLFFRSPPPQILVELFSALLVADKYGARDHRRPFQKNLAEVLEASRGPIPIEKLAELVGVAKNTVRGWKKDQHYIDRIAWYRDNPDRLRDMAESYREDIIRADSRKGFADR